MTQLPQFNNREEEAQFWDTHDVTELVGDDELTELTVKKPLTHTLSVRLDGSDMRRLESLARRRGIGVTTLARLLLRQALAESEQRLSIREMVQQEVSKEVARQLLREG